MKPDAPGRVASFGQNGVSQEILFAADGLWTIPVEGLRPEKELPPPHDGAPSVRVVVCKPQSASARTRPITIAPT